METHVKVLGILNIVAGAFGLCGALVLFLLFGISAGAVGTSGDPDAAFALPIIGLTGMALVTFAILTSLPAIIIGFGLLRFRPWARVGGIVMAVVSLMMFPFGTILGVYGLWVLFSAEGERLFATAGTRPV
jgi:hypothetical protein